MNLACAVCVELSDDPTEWIAALTIIDGIAVCQEHRGYLPDYYSDNHPLNQAVERVKRQH